jgi:hypothetical protein
MSARDRRKQRPAATMLAFLMESAKVKALAIYDQSS